MTEFWEMDPEERYLAKHPPKQHHVCERCDERQAVYFLARGIFVCYPCYNSPEDILRDL